MSTLAPRLFYFFGQYSRLRWVKRWGLKHNLYSDDVLGHSAEVAVIAHALATIRNVITKGGPVDANAVATHALFHDCSEAITGDPPTPVKYADPAMKAAYDAIRRKAEILLLDHIPPELKEVYGPLIKEDSTPASYRRLIKAADVLSAYAKCQTEINMGNKMEFGDALRDIAERLESFNDMEEVVYFRKHCFPSFHVSLDRQLSHQGEATEAS